MNGKYNRGDLFIFAHDLNEKRSKKILCADWLRGNCKRGDLCLFDHSKEDFR